MHAWLRATFKCIHVCMDMSLLLLLRNEQGRKPIFASTIGLSATVWASDAASEVGMGQGTASCHKLLCLFCLKPFGESVNVISQCITRQFGLKCSQQCTLRAWSKPTFRWTQQASTNIPSRCLMQLMAAFVMGKRQERVFHQAMACLSFGTDIWKESLSC